MDKQLQNAFMASVAEYVTGSESKSRYAFGWLLGFRTALCFSDVVTIDEHARLCRITDAAIDARYYILTLEDRRHETNT